MRAPLSFAILAALAAPSTVSAVEIDGRVDPAEWQGAQHITDFRMVTPLSREPARYPTEGWVMATPDGLAVALRNTQAADVPRTRQRAQRDVGGAADRVNLYVDFDGDNRAGYNFTVLLSDSIIDTTITNENQFNDDWDGDWRHATSEDDQAWYVEMLIPWHIAPMQGGNGDTRTIGLSLDRVIGTTGERMAWPAVTFTEQSFMSRFSRIEVPRYSQSLLAITPYVVGVFDNVNHKGDFDGGADLFWKPNGQFQLSATLNPDFGQVESDELVVNFGAIESFFSDKRPFFTENQAFFDVPFGSLNTANRLIYTRRVGARTDNDDGSGDVTAAVKVNGSVGGLNYGVFAATEADEVGRDFYAVRATQGFGEQGLGAMVTRVDRPFLDRVATVYEVDHRWAPTPQWNIRTTAVASDVEQAGAHTRDSGAQMRIDHELGDGWRQQLYLLHLGDGLQLNDFGYLERNNFNYGRYEIARRITDLPEDSPYRSHEWRGAVSRRVNDDGVHIADAWAINRQSNRRDGGDQFFEIASWTDGHDDLITRGNGVVNVPAKYFLFAERFRPRKAHWAFYGSARYAVEGLSGDLDKGAVTLELEPTYHVNDSLSFVTGLELNHNPDWLLWRGGNLLGTYRSDSLFLNAGAVWLIDSKQELRVKLEAIGLDARAQQAWRVAPDGRALAVDEDIPDFSLRNLGFQIRYRYELAPLSHLYIAYVRGGSMFDEFEHDSANGQGVDQQFFDAFDLRDSEQLLVKLAYRFEI
ncbi:DUF5916 domain-containing protein [Montanilutibacter psychrotolerans]|uniref:DUF5916 domain-containing protein n=1 Tax=Montanilutibacter psychrotolerans TaxID=1327343 RepID=A0A3M8SZ78_9GAMM|nr:DUF5916 domain-containing protein [Lysobacter psychrotolerans]RNF86529.1 hypothetical protein EER27_01260 [Lysobacter psychrotolerans]